jgi:aminomuconate-semialdehyde/2-hydroxymuconate-6-semialdehyde dehydrogenase
MADVLNYIDGVFVAAHSNATIANINPANGTIIGSVPASDATDVDLATKAALRALPTWKATSFEERINWLYAIADALQEQSQIIIALEIEDTGKPVSLARNIDAYRSVANFRFFADHGKQLPELKFEMDQATNYVHRNPIGVVGLITPWNLPLYLLSWKVAPALLMGNTIVAKPSEMTPQTATFLAKVMDDIGLPKGVFNLVHGLGPQAGQAIIEHPDIRGISFTGGTATGKIVAATAAPMFKKLSLELGGKNATIVLDDAPLEEMMNSIVRASFANSGQICLCGSRIFVHKSRYDEFASSFTWHVEQLKVGNPHDETTNMGSLISVEHRDKVESYINLAVEEGGHILTGGTSAQHPVANVPEGSAFLRPTVIGGLPAHSRCATEEIFGPVVTLHKFDTETDLLEMVNGTNYGLAGSIWTGDKQRGHLLATKVETGILWVNTWLHRDLRTPFGGVKNSGVGREGGDWSLNFFSELLNVCVHE